MFNCILACMSSKTNEIYVIVWRPGSKRISTWNQLNIFHTLEAAVIFQESLPKHEMGRKIWPFEHTPGWKDFDIHLINYNSFTSLLTFNPWREMGRKLHKQKTTLSKTTVVVFLPYARENYQWTDYRHKWDRNQRQLKAFSNLLVFFRC